jgi:cell wall-associated NlpC family hydrolase
VRATAALAFAFLAACANTQRSTHEGTSAVAPAVADRAASQAVKMVGRPYHYGGASPAGFDCSGLVLFSYQQAGLKLPRDTEHQRLASNPVRVSSLRRGDLVFFDHEGKKNSHVGIYLGDGTFVHAPSSGKRVRTDRLDSAYWKKHLSEARRLNG